MTLILGSTSSARAKLLTQLGICFQTRVPSYEERSLPYGGDPIDYCSTLSHNKNLSITRHDQKELIVTFDTIVFCKNRVLNKPINYDEAVDMLKLLSGSLHQVMTACSVSYDDKLITRCEISDVQFHQLDQLKIERFLEDPHFIHRAGAYTVTGKGALLIKDIKGSYENIVGIPLNTLESLLNEWNFSLWDLSV